MSMNVCKHQLFNKYTLIIWVLLFTACEKLTLPEETSSQPDGNLTVTIYQLEQTPFSALTRAAASETCTRLNFAIYDMEGNRLKQENQKVDESDFGTASFQLEEGTYQLVVLAHSSDGNPTMTNPAKIQFTNATRYTDTFLYHTTVTVTDEPQTLALTLSRIVALCRFVITDAIPEGVAKMQFYYTGGSGAFDATTGLGCVNSKQDVKFEVHEGDTQTHYDLYTFLHEQEGTIQLTVSALDSDDHELYKREFTIPLKQNQITTYTGTFFTGVTPTASQSLTTTVTLNTIWANETQLTY